MYRSSRLLAWREARQLRRSLRVVRQGSQELVVSVHGELDAQQTTRMGQALGDLVSYGPLHAHIDLDGTDQVAGIGDVFVRLSASARSHHTRVTVHRASPEQRAALRRFGLDRLLFYSDQAP